MFKKKDLYNELPFVRESLAHFFAGSLMALIIVFVEKAVFHNTIYYMSYFLAVVLSFLIAQVMHNLIRDKCIKNGDFYIYKDVIDEYGIKKHYWIFADCQDTFLTLPAEVELDEYLQTKIIL